MIRDLRPGPRPRALCLLAIALSAFAGTAEAASTQDPSRLLTRTHDSGPTGLLAADRGASGLWQRLQKLRTTGSVLYTTGHPDDEEPGVLTLLSRGHGVRTALLTLNRGEGGANAIGPELFDALGLIRSEELRIAGRYYGLDDQYFTSAVDYGYSKTMDEAFSSWDREAIVADMVRIIRQNRPLVVISRWHGSVRDGHGHHQAAGVLTPEAVGAAADPLRFPEQISQEGLSPWRVRKLYRGRIQGSETWNVEVDPHASSPWLGSSYQAFGSYGLSLQRSQTAGRVRGGRGSAAPTRYQRLSGAGPDREESIFDGLDLSLSGVFGLVSEPGSPAAASALVEAETHIASAIAAFDFTDPEAVAPHLALARTALDRALAEIPSSSDAAFIVGLERRELDAALAGALGLELAAVATPRGADAGQPMSGAVPGQDIDVHVALTVSGSAPVDLRSLTVESREQWSTGGGIATGRVEAGGSRSGVVSLTIPADAEPTRPWFFRTSIAENVYSVRDSSEIHLGESRPRTWARARVEFEGQTLEITAPIVTIESLAPYGTAWYPLTVAPAISVQASPSAVVLRPEDASVSVSVHVVSNSPSPVDAMIDLDLPGGWRSVPEVHEVRLGRPGESETVLFSVTAGTTPTSPTTLRARIRAGGRVYGEGYQRIVHRDLAPMFLYSDASVDVVPVDVLLAPGLRVGYVMGVGDDVPAAIEQLGADVYLLAESDLASGDLTAFDAIVVGTRAYAVRADLVANNRRLIDYASGGGNLIVLYQTQEYTPETQAPYPASLPGNAQEVSEEDAPVTILAPGHELLTSPNRIGASDFEAWIEQRGSKFFATWSAEYTPLIETHDTGQDPQEGVWLTSEVGSGHFTYASLALHRQLPYGVPGAYRILANLISLGR